MTDVVTSLVRTAASKAVGGLLGVALALGVAVPAELSEQLTVAVTVALAVAVQLVYYVIARLVEQHVPAIGKAMLWSGKVPLYGTDLPINIRAVIDHESVIEQVEAVKREIARGTDPGPAYRFR